MAIIRTMLILFELLILVRVLLTFFPGIDTNNALIRFVHDVTEPVLRPIRNLLPSTGMFDFSPVIVILILQVLTSFLR